MLKLLKNLRKTDWITVLFSVGLIVLQVWLELKIPDYMNTVTSLVTTGGAMSEVWKNGGMMLLCALASAGGAILVGFFAARIAAGLAQRLRALVFDKVENFSMEEINRFSTASLITRSTNDITQVQMTVAMGLQAMIKAPIMAVWAITVIAGKSWQWTAATGIAVAIMLVMVAVLVLIVLPKFKKVQAMTDNLNLVTRENLTGVRVVRAYNMEKYQSEKFAKANEELTATHLFTMRSMSLMMPVMTIVMNGLSLAIFWIGAVLINQANILDKAYLFADMVTFTSYAMQVVGAFMMLTMIFIMLPRAEVSAKRINEVLHTDCSIFDGEAVEGLPGVVGEVEFKNVSFRYPDAEDYVLKDISFRAKNGETVAFIGSTGSGKSTVVNLIPRFYDATEGEVLVDGINVKEYKQSALRDKLGYVPQRAVMFSGTVASNVAYGAENVAEDEVAKAVDVAQGTEFVSKMSGGYNASIARGGTNVSGGQKQRLSIARAIYRKPEIFIFDDTFSALDFKTDKDLRTALKKETNGSTSLIVAQRIGTIRDADRIIVLNEGEEVGNGTHDELMKNCEIYREIAYSQYSKEELENE